MTFVYIPSHLRLDQTIDTSPFITLENRIKGIWTELGADFVSLSDFLATVDDPLTVYGMEDSFSSSYGTVHFSRDGYRRTATYIIDYLKHRDPTLNIKFNSGRVR